MKYLFITLIFISKVGLTKDINKQIENFILENPEIIIKSLENYEKKIFDENTKKNKKQILQKSSQIFNSDNGMFSGDKNAKHTIVEFFDYNCSYCKKAHNDLKKVLNNVPNVKVVYKNFPILSEQSMKLAKIALLISMKSNEKFNIFHDAVMKKKGLLSEDDLSNVLKKINLNLSNLERELDNKQISQNIFSDTQLAKDLNLQGTPAFIINNDLFFGYIDYDEIVKILNN